MKTPVRAAWVDLGLTKYDEAFAIQEDLHRQRCAGLTPNIILFQENFHVITLGRSASMDNLLASPQELAERCVTVCNVSRGGDISYHGPGQQVISPIFKLCDIADGAHQYVSMLEQVVINLLAVYGIRAARAEGAPGVWVGNNKIAALGIAIKNGITQHGVAINVYPDLSYFDLIVPCGLKGKGVTSLKAILTKAPTLAEIRKVFVQEFSRVFSLPPILEYHLPAQLRNSAGI